MLVDYYVGVNVCCFVGMFGYGNIFDQVDEFNDFVFFCDDWYGEWILFGQFIVGFDFVFVCYQKVCIVRYVVCSVFFVFGIFQDDFCVMIYDDIYIG